MTRQEIIGRLVTGVGQATGFTGLDWARAGFRHHLGIDPYPGTLNLVAESRAAREAWAAVRASEGIVLEPPRADWCKARLWHATIQSQIAAGIVLPELAAYPGDQIELIAAVGIRRALALSDGAQVAIEVEVD